MTGTYDLLLVALSVVIAGFASLTALDLAGRVAVAEGAVRRVWLAGGSLAMGVGIWSMHFVGMLAFHLPVPVAYDVPLWLLSAAVAVGASLLALWTVGRPRPHRAALPGAALFMGAAIAGMHYLGMAAMRLPGRITYHPGLVAASVAIALLASGAALWLALRFRDDPSLAGRGKVAAAAVMGIAISGMHYTAMAAAHFHPGGGSAHVRGDQLLATDGLAVSVALGTAAVLGVALAAAGIDRRLRVRSAAVHALRRSEDRFRSLVEATAQIVWTAAPDGRLVGEQPSWSAFTGQTPAEYEGSGWLEAIHPDDREPTLRRWREALAGGTAYQAEHRVRRRDGEYRHTEVRAVPVREPDGSVREWIGAHEDVTAWKRHEAERDLLAEAGRVLASSLDYQETLAAVTRLAVPAVADWCAVDELTPHGEIRRIAVAHPDPARVELAHRLQEVYPALPDDPYGVAAVLRTGEPELVTELPDELLVAAARDEEHLRVARELGLRSYMIVPLAARGRILGALSLVSAESGRRYGPADLSFSRELAHRAALAVDNARLFRDALEAREMAEEQALEMEAQAAELEEAQAETEMANDELQHAVRELEARTREAERARAAADEANEAKSAFLATMSHELRTPLNAIGGYTELMELGIRGPVTEQQRQDLAKIRRSQQRLLGLINDVLNFARIEAGQVRYRMKAVSLDEVLSGVESLVHPQLAARGLRYSYHAVEPGVAAHADRERLEQVVLNLLTNAIKFTPAGGEVALTAVSRGGEVEIRVADTGVGIPADRLEAIFEPFVQVDPSLTREAEGTGLGLAISRDLARAMGGDLTAESTPGEGSTFTLRLPRATDGAAAEEAVA